MSAHSASASAASYPLAGSRAPPFGSIGASAAASIVETSQSRAERIAATSRAYFPPASSLSGQMRTRRPASGVQSLLCAACAPPLDVVAIDLGKIRAAASAAFSPSVTTTGVSQHRAQHLAEADYRRGLGEPDGKEGVLIAGAPARNASLPPRRSALLRLANAAAGSSKNMTPRSAQHHVEAPGPEPVHLGVDDLEPGVSDASSSGEPTRFGYLNAGQVRAESVPAAGVRVLRGLSYHRSRTRCRERSPRPGSGRRRATASSAGERTRSCRSRCSMKCRPLAPFQSSACSAFTGTKETLHRPRNLPGPVPDAPSGTLVPEIATVAGLARAGSSARCRSSDRCSGRLPPNRPGGPVPTPAGLAKPARSMTATLPKERCRCTGQPGDAATSTAPAKPTNAGTPTPRKHRDHNELPLPYLSEVTDQYLG